MDTSYFFREDDLYQWEFKNKGYPHFDTAYPAQRIETIIGNIEKHNTLTHSFYPLIKFQLPKVKRDKETGRVYIDANKPRPIMHTARIDANIYSLYRNILMNSYDAYLEENGISECVTAYRRIPVSENTKQDRNKCNLHFATEAINEIKRQTTTNNLGCTAIAMDIKGFFENLDHGIIKRSWCRVMGYSNGMPKDHWTVYKNITRYTYIDAQNVERILDINFKKISRDNRKQIKAKKEDKPSDPLKVQICGPDSFRKEILPFISAKNTLGIPQGTTISDVIANMYLIDFDKTMKRFADKYNGYYRRYSDDILFIGPQNYKDKAVKFIPWLLKRVGKTIHIGSDKTLISDFAMKGEIITCNTFDYKGPVGKPFEYLGLSFDGQTIRLRQSTISKFYDRLSARIKAEAIIALKKRLKRNPSQLPSAMDMYRIMSFDMIRNSYMENIDDDEFIGNFYSYAQLAADITGNQKIGSFYHGLNRWIRKRAKRYCQIVLSKHISMLSRYYEKEHA